MKAYLNKITPVKTILKNFKVKNRKDFIENILQIC